MLTARLPARFADRFSAPATSARATVPVRFLEPSAIATSVPAVTVNVALVLNDDASRGLAAGPRRPRCELGTHPSLLSFSGPASSTGSTGRSIKSMMASTMGLEMISNHEPPAPQWMTVARAIRPHAAMSIRRAL